MTQALRLRQDFSRFAANMKVIFADIQAEEDAFELADMEDVEIGAEGKISIESHVDKGTRVTLAMPAAFHAS
jgi:hypothetical protein